jgi:hypothetical protein
MGVTARISALATAMVDCRAGALRGDAVTVGCWAGGLRGEAVTVGCWTGAGARGARVSAGGLGRFEAGLEIAMFAVFKATRVCFFDGPA